MLSRITSIFHDKGYRINHRPFELNILGIRSPQTRANAFDDEIHVFYQNDKASWEHHVFSATTDPGTYWLKNPMSPQGTAILEQGQYVNAYQLGYHQGKYLALVQRGPVNVLRDYDRDAVLDFLNGKPYQGVFGINIHRAMAQGDTKTVDKFSAGCQVLANADDFQKLMSLCERHRGLYGNQFNYTLIDLRAITRETHRRVILGSLAGVMFGMGLYLYLYD